MPAIVHSGTELGVLRPDLQAALDAGALRVIAPATHDTGSAVAGTPLRPHWAYISSGTWSLVGVERPAPIVNAAAARANFTNEAGAGGTVRFLKNVTGLWLLEECRREWDRTGAALDHSRLAERAAAVGGCAGLIYPDDPRFFNPRSMTAEIRASLAGSGQPAHEDPVLLAKVILDSLALRYASVLSAIESLTGLLIEGIHIVGGGALNRYLNQATADAAGRPVIAGPVEATAVGNLIVQAIACGEVASLAEARALVASSVECERFVPRRLASWTEAARRYREIEAQCAA
jgi:rhamnulokinase